MRDGAGVMLKGSSSAVAAALILAACGSTVSSGNGVASKPPAQIANAAIKSAKSARSVHVSGTIESGGRVGLDLDLVAGRGAAGSISHGTAAFKVVVTGGDLYFQGNRAFWSKIVHTEGVVQLLLGKWIREPGSAAQFASISRLTSIDSLMTALVDNLGTLTKGSSTTIGGHSAIALRGSKGRTLYVATTGKPYPLRVVDRTASGGEITFTQYNHSFTIAAPKNSVNAPQPDQGGT